MESPNKRIKLVDLSADEQLSPDSLEAKMNVNFKNVQKILDSFYKYHFRNFNKSRPPKDFFSISALTASVFIQRRQGQT